MADVEFHIDKEKLWRLICKQDATYQTIRSTTDAVANEANALSAGYRTGKYYRDHKAPAVGGTQPVYMSNTRRNPTVPVGIAYTGNYAAKKDNYAHNTLLKAMLKGGS